MQGGKGIFDSLCHGVNCVLFLKGLTTNDGVDGGIDSGEVFVFVSVQLVRLGDGRVNLAVIRALVLQRGKGIFDSLCHGIYFALLGNVFTTDDGVDSGFNGGEVRVVILLQSICLGEGCIDLGVVGVLVLQRGKGIFDSLCHCVNFVLFSDVLVTDNSIDGSINSGEVLVVVPVQCFRLGDGRVNLAVIRALVLQRGYCVFDSLCHRVNFGLFRKRLAADDGVDRGFHSGEILVFVTVQRVCLGDGRVYCTVICRAILKLRIIARLRKRIAQRTCHGSVFKFFCRLLIGSSCIFCSFTFSIEAFSIEAVCGVDHTPIPWISRKNASGLG